jgi:site-specific DNA-methyltransferase (adenine-specific)
MRIVEFKDGIAINGSFGDKEISEKILQTSGKLPLINADVPYFNIVPEDWDKTKADDIACCNQLIEWTKACESISLPGGACYVYGGTGKYLFRPFWRYCVEVEHETNYQIGMPITWQKRRAYGVKTNFLYTREEIVYLVLGDAKKPRCFNIPYLEKKRGYSGYNKRYPAKSEFLRRGAVWSDITEIFKGKIHPTQKPQKLIEVIIETHTNAGEWCLDPFAGSGSTAKAARKLDRKFILVEKNPVIFDKMISYIER